MSNVLERHRGISEMEFYVTAINIRHELTTFLIEQSYMSWRGYILQKDAYDSVKSMDALFFDLFHTKPWKNKKNKSKRRVQNGRKKTVYSGRNQRPEVIAC